MLRMSGYSRRTITCGALLALLLLALLTMLVRPGSSDGASERTRTQRIDDISERTLQPLIEQQREDGTFDDLRGDVGGGGLPQLAWPALRAARRAPEDSVRRQQLRDLAEGTLKQGTAGSQVMGNWPLAIMVSEGLHRDLSENRSDAITRKILQMKEIHAPGVAEKCLRDPGCINNYKLFRAAYNMELVRSGLNNPMPGYRLSNPRKLHKDTSAELRRLLPRWKRPGARINQPGMKARTANVFSDPSTYPLAYHAMNTALAMRVQDTWPGNPPRELIVTTRSALWALVGMAAPNGEVSWMGRGQDQSWVLGASVYAALAGARAYQVSDPALAARLRRLADVQLTALEKRLSSRGMQQVPGADRRRTHDGIDHYASGVGNAALALTFLELARDAANESRGRKTLAFPAQRNDSRFKDLQASGIVTRRSNDVWMGVHLRRDHQRDGRQDFGLVRALRKDEDGRWRELLPARPKSWVSDDTQRVVPSAGPVLTRSGRTWEPRVDSVRNIKGGVEARGAWRSGNDRRAASWRWYRAQRNGSSVARMTTPCPRGAVLQIVQWLPQRGEEAVKSPRRLARAGFSVTSNLPFRAQRLKGVAASSRDERLIGYQTSWRCNGRAVQLNYSGQRVARG